MIGPRRSAARPRERANATDASGGSASSTAPRATSSGACAEGRGARKRPRYAWMDSGDDDSSAESVEEQRSSASAERSDMGKAPPLPASAAEVRSFSEMLRMAPGLRRRAASMEATELASVCAASARVLYYDAGLLQALTSRLRRLLARRSSGLNASALITVLSGLAELNTYDREVFAAALGVLAVPGTIERVDKAQRQQLLAALRAVKHQGNTEFVEALARREKFERYEAAKDELMKRNLTRMYGETLDLQGASEDVERALLKPRFQKTRTR